ncbi:MAG: VOC family protein [Pseudomonadota bacterium]
MTHPPLVRLTLYTRKMDEMAAFYAAHFGYSAWSDPADRIVELRPPGTGAILHLHPLAKGQKPGQVVVKLGFEVEDVHAFIARAASRGLQFGKPFKGDGYLFANAKDPAGNSISVTSRGSAKLDLRPWTPDAS